jgi:hypothetical protein
MSARTAVLIAGPFAVLATVLRIGGVLYWQPVTWRFGLLPGILAFLGSFAVSVSIPLAGYLLLTRSARRKPSAWHLDTGGTSWSLAAHPHPADATLRCCCTSSGRNRWRRHLNDAGYRPAGFT